MSANKSTDEFKRDAVAQVEDRGYRVREVAERLEDQRQTVLLKQAWDDSGEVYGYPLPGR